MFVAHIARLLIHNVSSILVIGTSNHMFGRVIWDKLLKCIFENFELSQVKRGQFQHFKKSRG